MHRHIAGPYQRQSQKAKPCFKEYSMTACLNRMSCVILFITDRVAPAFWFCLGNSTLTQTIPIRYSFFCLSHIIVTPTPSSLQI